SQETKASRAGLSGRGMPGGGMAPIRTFWKTFSQTSACAATSVMPAASKASPAVRSRSLWQPTQYERRTASGSDGVAVGELAGCCALRRGNADGRDTAIQPATRSRTHLPRMFRGDLTEARAPLSIAIDSHSPAPAAVDPCLERAHFGGMLPVRRGPGLFSEGGCR